MMLVAWAARRPALLQSGETRGGTANILVSMAASPLVFIAAAGLALHNARQALYLLVLLIPAGWIADRLGRALQRRIDGAAARGV